MVTACPSFRVDYGLWKRMIWQFFQLSDSVRDELGLLFTPGASVSRVAVPVVSMSQNLLPFEKTESSRFGFSGNVLAL